MTNGSHEAKVSVAVAPRLTTEVYYFQETTVPITIINKSDKSLLVETVDLRFQGDSGVDVVVSKDITSVVEPERIIEAAVSVTPTPRYMAATNQFKMRIQFREHEEAGVGRQKSQVYDHPPLPYVIIKPSEDKLGTAFISFKQPDDRDLSRIVERFAKRAGFVPYLAEKQPEPGTDVWDRIDKELKGCSVGLILWTLNTNWGEGVKREVQLIRDATMPHALIVEEGAHLPDEYEDGDIEHAYFNRETPHDAIERAVIAMRRAVLAH